MLLCQISDPHIVSPGELAYGRVDTALMLDLAVFRITSLSTPPDAVVVTGDLTDSAQPDAYRLLAELLSPLKMPIYLLCGNHDRREPLQASFPDQTHLRGEGGFVQYVIEQFPLRLVVLDTTEPGQEGGRLCAQRLQWLDRTLAQSDKPTVIAQHHPPFATGMAMMDTMSLANPQEEEAIVARHANVERVISGHYHRQVQARFAGTMASICPSTAQQLILDLAPHAGIRIGYEPPAFQLHLWDGTRLISHTVPVGDFPTWGTHE
jgi:3',5'-cyclic-AMP phosphodiesterase